MYKRRKRRSRFIWFPIHAFVNEASPTPKPEFDSTLKDVILNINTSGQPFIAAFPLLVDVPSGAELQDYGAGLAIPDLLVTDVEANEYFIRRIVGKFRCALLQDDTAGACPGVACTVGMFVGRSDPDQTDLPQGFGSLASQVALLSTYSPANQGTAREPWIWRRQWILGNSPQGTTNGTSALTDAIAYYPFNNENLRGGGTYDGPHVDAKTMRRVHHQERLWLCIDVRPAWNLTTETSFSKQPQIWCQWDFRVLGQLRKAKGKGTFT